MKNITFTLWLTVILTAVTPIEATKNRKKRRVPKGQVEVIQRLGLPTVREDREPPMVTRECYPHQSFFEGKTGIIAHFTKHPQGVTRLEGKIGAEEFVAEAQSSSEEEEKSVEKLLQEAFQNWPPAQTHSSAQTDGAGDSDFLLVDARPEESEVDPAYFALCYLTLTEKEIGDAFLRANMTR